MTMDWSLMEYYQEIEKTGQRMLEAARLRDWDQVRELEAVCEGLISLVQKFDPERRLDPAQRAEKARIMQRLLVLDAEIRNLLDPLIGDFGHSLDSTGHTLH
jgi:flagellar protein FliT